MSKHRAPHTWHWQEREGARHLKGWNLAAFLWDKLLEDAPYTPGKHAKPFAAHHPARPVTYDAAGTTTPLNPPTNVLDVAA